MSSPTNPLASQQPQLIQFEGQTHVFPADFSQAEIQKALSSYKPPASSPNLTQGSRFNLLPSQRSDINNFSNNPNPIRPNLVSATEAARPFAVGPAVEAGTMAAEAAAPAGPLAAGLAGIGVGGATYLGLDSALQKVRNYLSGSSEGPSLEDSAKNLAINTGLSKVAELGTSVGKAILNSSKVAPTLEQLKALSPTLSQALDAMGYKGASKIVGGAEDIFTPIAKEKSIQESGKIAQNLVQKQTVDLTKSPILPKGRAQSVINNPEFFGRTMQTDLENAQQATYDQADKQAEMARLVAKGNLGTKQEVRTIYQEDGKPLMRGIQQVPIEGPVNLSTTLQRFNKLIQDNHDPLLISDSDKPALKKAVQYVTETMASFDLDGNLMHAEPIPFNKAWQLKKDVDALGGWNKFRENVTDTDRSMRGIASDLNQDITDSLSKWQNDPKQIGLKSWLNAKAIAEERNNVYSVQHSEVPTLSKLIQTTSSPLPTLEATINDSQSLQRFLNTGEQKFQGVGTNPPTIESTNARADAAGYGFYSKWLKGQPADSTQPIDAMKIKSAFNDPMWREPRDILYNQQTRSNIDKLLDNIDAVQKRPQTGWMSKVQLVRNGLMLTPALLGMSVSGEAAMHAAGAELGAYALTKLMTSKPVARTFINFVGGQPLEMSERMFAQRMASALQGVTISLVGDDGKRVRGTIDKDGNFEKEEQ